MTPEPSDRHSFHIRIPDDLWERLVKASKDKHFLHINTAITQAIAFWLDAVEAREKGDE